jgi:hypothetical protein
MNIDKTSVSLTNKCLLAGLLRSLLMLLLLMPVLVQAQFTYMTNNGTITITSYTGPDGNPIIPATINGLPVTRIGDFAFSGRTKLTSITIPTGVTYIGDAAFSYCASLTSVTIGNSVAVDCRPGKFRCWKRIDKTDGDFRWLQSFFWPCFLSSAETGLS